MTDRPKVLLFDIGGVCVTSPMQAIANYETTHSIPAGWINHSISHSGPQGSWSRLERGEIPLDSTFFASFQGDLTNEKLWRVFYAKHLTRNPDLPPGAATEEAAFIVPPVPDIDAEALFWEMMRVARTPDAAMWPALNRLRAFADDATKQDRLIIAALSNTCVFPTTHPFNATDTPEGRFQAELRALFDVFVSSAHVGMRKPEKRIYEFALGRLGEVARGKGWEEGVLHARDVLFLDDIGVNLRGAREVGMRTLKVGLGRADLAVRELERVMGLDLTGKNNTAKL